MTNPFVRKLRHGAALSDEDERVLAQLAEPVQHAAPRTDVLREGERPPSLTLILEGWACRYRDLPDGRRQIVAFFLPGDLCEPYGMLPRRADHSLATITAVDYVQVPLPVAHEAARSSPAIGRALWWDLLVANSLLVERTVSLGRRTAFERLGHLICELHARLGLVGLADDRGYALPVTQRDLADALGVSDVHLNRSLQALRSTGLITLGERRMTIHDLAGLRDVSLFEPSFLHPRGTIAD